MEEGETSKLKALTNGKRATLKETRKVKYQSMLITAIT